MEILSYKDLRKNLKKGVENGHEVKVSLLGDTATQMLNTAIAGYGIEHKLKVDLFEADYDQIELQLSIPNSETYEHNPDFIVIYKSSEKLLKKYYKTGLQDKNQLAEQTLSELRQLILATQKYSKAKVILFNFIELPDMVFNNYGNKTAYSWTYQLRKLNVHLMELAEEIPGLFICDLQAIVSQQGRQHLFDPQTYVRTDIVTNFEFLPRIAASVTDILSAAIGKFKKCLILDLDNTTWGGIIGDDGMEGIQIGDLGLGKAFTELQSWAKNLKERGIILAVCSKNTESIAKEPFQEHPDMVLRLEDISVFVANWENKAHNIRYIQSILNIGFDSMVFLDDNPAERALVRAEIPEVVVPELPEDPAEYIPYLQQFNLFETVSYSQLDKDRTKQYQVAAERKVLEKSFDSMDDFLKNLEMKAQVVPFDKFNVPRISQLTLRSNQFNLRTQRYSEEDINRIMSSDDYITLSVSLEDKFGNYGLISLLIAEKKAEDTYFIDTWIMSCRVLKRDVEILLLQELIVKAKSEGVKLIQGERIPTKKNVIVADHYKDLGFDLVNEQWLLNLDDKLDLKEHHISII